MYKRHTGQLSMLEEPEYFGTLPLDPNNEWIKLSKLVPWHEFDQKYRENFRSKKGQRAIDSRIALGALLIKPAYKGISDEDLTREIAMNPYLQYFLGLHSYRYECPFDASMMTRFRQRISPEMVAWVNDQVIGRKAEETQRSEKDDEDKNTPSGEGTTNNETEEGNNEKTDEEASNEGTLILDATCLPQEIRFPIDASLLNEAREKAEEIIDTLHKQGLTGAKKPRTYRKTARNKYNSFSKTRKKSKKMIRQIIRQQLGYLRRDLDTIRTIEEKKPGSLKQVLSSKQIEQYAVIQMLYHQQLEMYCEGTHRVDDRIVSISQPWIRPIVRGKQNADVEFGAKAEMSIVNGFLRIEVLKWEAFNESKTMQQSVEAYKKSYGHYPERVLADTIFRTRENLSYCKDHGIHMNGPKLGKPNQDLAERKKQKKLEWLESGERGEIERNFGVGKRRYMLDRIVTKLKETSETSIHISVLYMNLRKKLRLLLRNFLIQLTKIVVCEKIVDCV